MHLDNSFKVGGASYNPWNNIASAYEAKFMQLTIYDHTYDLVCNALPLNADVLDVACGPGNITRYLLTKRPDLKIKATDSSSEMIAIAQKNNPAAEFFVSDINEIDRIDGLYAAIICGFCLPYLTEAQIKKFAYNAYHLLTSKGLLYLSFVEGDPSDSGMKIGSTGYSIFFHYHTLQNVIALLDESGFDKPQITRVNYDHSGTPQIHTIVLCRKFQ